MSCHILLYTDDPVGERLARFNHVLLIALVERGYRVTCVQSRMEDTTAAERAAKGVRHLWLDFDTRLNLHRTMTDGTDATRVFETARPDMIVFSDRIPISNLAARHIAIGRRTPFIVFVDGGAQEIPTPYEKAAVIARAQYEKAVAVATFSQASLGALLGRFGLTPARAQALLPEPDFSAPARVAGLSLVSKFAPRKAARPLAPTGLMSKSVVVDPTADVSVYLPTFNRPDMLPTALRSVRDQTSRHRIREVLVSENSPSDASAEICLGFANDLPIRYVRRRRTFIADPFVTPYTAVLHDDDWWAPDHLQCGLDAMEKHNAVACFAAFFEISGEISPLRCDSNMMFWLGSNFQPLTDNWVLSPEMMVLSCLPGTPGRYSTLILRSGAVRGCEFVEQNLFDNDRMLDVALAMKGPVVFRPRPTAYIRMHAEQDCRRFSQPQIVQRMYETTMWILGQAKTRGIDAVKLLNERFAACAPSYHRSLLETLNVPWTRLALQNEPDLPPLLSTIWPRLESKPAAAAPILAATAGVAS